MKQKREKTLNYVLGKKYDGFMGRCYREKDPSYKNYGAKGIKACSEWIKNIDSFKSWAINKLKELNIPQQEFTKNSAKYQLDRKNGRGHYTPNNCTFSSPLINNRNRLNRNKRYITSAEGEEILV